MLFKNVAAANVVDVVVATLGRRVVPIVVAGKGKGDDAFVVIEVIGILLGVVGVGVGR